MRYYLIFILSLSINSEIFKGRILDSENNPLENSNIELIAENKKNGTISDKDGFFIISNILSGDYTVIVSHIGYQDYVDKISFPGNKFLSINMIDVSIGLDRVVITGTRSERHIKDTPMLTHVIDSGDIENSTYSNVKDILEMAMPNVQMVSSNHSNDRVKIQGLDNKYLTFLVDGDRVSGEFAGNLDFSMFGLQNVKKIEVIEGAMSTLYGSGAIGGVVNIITEKNKSPYLFRMGIQYDNPIGISRSVTGGLNKGIFHYSLSIQENNSTGYDLTPEIGVYNMTLDKNTSQLYSHNFWASPNNKHSLNIFHKDYSSRIYKYKYEADNLFLDAPLNRYDDKYSKIKHEYNISESKSLKISYIEEEYLKYYLYPYYYSDNEFIYNPNEFLNGLMDRKEINIHFNSSGEVFKRLIGVESFNEKYSSFNIYYPNGSILQESIFQGYDLTKNESGTSLYFYEERNLNKNKIFSLGLRIQNILDEDIFLPSLSYLIKGNNSYNYRISYTEGYRKPSIKERYYQWEDHAGPDIIGDSDLKPTENMYFSLSLDKRTFINDFSVDFYQNEIKNIISTEYDEFGNLLYKNYDKVIINGTNIHYYRKVSDKLKLKFVYNLTNPISASDEILEGISKHSLRLKLDYKLMENIDLTTNLKFSGKKNIFDQEQDFVGNQSIKELTSYFLSDLYLTTRFKNNLFIFGIKNIFNYKDPSRVLSDILNNYDPGRRIYVEYTLTFENKNDIK